MKCNYMIYVSYQVRKRDWLVMITGILNYKYLLATGCFLCQILELPTKFDRIVETAN